MSSKDVNLPFLACNHVWMYLEMLSLKCRPCSTTSRTALRGLVRWILFGCRLDIEGTIIEIVTPNFAPMRRTSRGLALLEVGPSGQSNLVHGCPSHSKAFSSTHGTAATLCRNGAASLRHLSVVSPRDVSGT